MLSVNIVKSVLNGSLLLTMLRTLFLLVRFFYSCIRCNYWCRFSNNIYLVWCSFQPLWEMAKLQFTSGLMFRIVICQILVAHLQQRSHMLAANLRVFRMAGNHQVMDLAVQQILQWKKAVGWCSWCSLLHKKHNHYWVCRMALFYNFWMSGRA